MTYLSAAQRVLKTAGRSLTTSEITAVAIKRGFIEPTGATPEATMSAVLYRFVRDNPDGPISREWMEGPTRARRDSVRWVYVA